MRTTRTRGAAAGARDTIMLLHTVAVDVADRVGSYIPIFTVNEPPLQ